MPRPAARDLPKPNFAQRSRQPEWMDELDADEAIVKLSLSEIKRINQLLGGYDVTLSALSALLPQLKRLDRPVRILDLASGGGDGLEQVARWAHRKQLPVELIGSDWNPVMLAHAEAATVSPLPIEWRQLDIWSEGLPEAKADILLNSLFLHHVDQEAVPALLKRMQGAAGVAVIINDLHRHWFAYHSIKLLTRLLGRSPMVQYDAPLSVARGFSRPELASALALAGIKAYELRWRWAWRWQLVIPGSRAAV